MKAWGEEDFREKGDWVELIKDFESQGEEFTFDLLYVSGGDCV